jgi:lysophospholipase L1-like esterase
MIVICSLFAGSAAQANPRPGKVTPPKAYYLALGDSLAYGFQQARFDAEFPNIKPATFNTGYVDDFARRLARLSPGIQVINDGCPGETSASLINGNRPNRCAVGGGWPSIWLHHPYSGSQLSDAIAFLTKHPRQTSPVTINIGGNDLLAIEQACANSNGGNGTPGDLKCLAQQLPVTIGQVAQNLGSILSQIRAAAPTTELIVMGLYNPAFTIPGADAVIEGDFNPTMATVASQFHGFFADPFPAINHGSTYPNEAVSVCSQIGICTPPLFDVHPFDNGYAAIADVIFAASGYARLD